MKPNVTQTHTSSTVSTALAAFVLVGSIGACSSNEEPSVADSTLSSSGDDAGTGAPMTADDDTEGHDTRDHDTRNHDNRGDDPHGDDDDQTSSDDTSGFPCEDQMTLDLGLVRGHSSEGEITSLEDGTDWVSTLDATAGGLPSASMNPWLYARFTTDGLERVDIDDFDALQSEAWDIAVKRFGIRLNSGASGPSNVGATTLVGVDFGSIDDAPEGEYREEDFYSDTCTLIDDDAGQGAPNYVLTPWWYYPGCVATSGVPFVLRRADGSHVKLVIEAYYESGQDQCNSSGTMGSGSAIFTWRWAFVS